jgi:hypothetical protein
MTRPLLPDSYINVPLELLRMHLPASAFEVAIWIFALLCGGVNESPAISMNQLEELTGKGHSVLYGNLRLLQSLGVLLFRPGGSATFIFSCGPKFQISGKLEVLNPLIPLIDSTIEKEKDLNNSEIPENRKNDKDNKNCVSRDLLNPFVESLASVTGLDKKLNYGRLAREAKDLIQAGYSVDQVQAVYGAGGVWYLQDWRGQKGELPQLGVIRSTIAQLLAAPKNGNAKKSNGRQPALDIRTDEENRALAESLS